MRENIPINYLKSSIHSHNEFNFDRNFRFGAQDSLLLGLGRSLKVIVRFQSKSWVARDFMKIGLNQSYSKINKSGRKLKIRNNLKENLEAFTWSENIFGASALWWQKQSLQSQFGSFVEHCVNLCIDYWNGCELPTTGRSGER